MTVNKHCYIVDMEPQIHLIVGYMAFDVKKQRPVATNSWPRRTSKIYTSAGMAKTAMKLSNHGKDLESGAVTIIPVTVPT